MLRMYDIYDIYTIHQDSLRPESAGSLLPVAVALLLGRASATTSPGFPSQVSRKDRMSEAEGLSLRTIKHVACVDTFKQHQGRYN